jgi:hypothetical protein
MQKRKAGVENGWEIYQTVYKVGESPQSRGGGRRHCSHPNHWYAGQILRHQIDDHVCRGGPRVELRTLRALWLYGTCLGKHCGRHRGTFVGVRYQVRASGALRHPFDPPRALTAPPHIEHRGEHPSKIIGGAPRVVFVATRCSSGHSTPALARDIPRLATLPRPSQDLKGGIHPLPHHKDQGPVCRVYIR